MTRIPISVQPGQSNVLFVHDVADDQAQRAEFRATASAAGGWWLDLRGHRHSGWVRGGVYDLPGFTADVLGVLLHRMPPGVRCVGQGVGGLLAAAAAAIAPDRVRGVRLVEGNPTGWTEDVVVTAAHNLLPNPDWLYAKDSFDGPAEPGTDDPVLRLGPPAPTSRVRLDSILAGLRCEVSGSAGWVDAVLPG